jgi:hypothetical protein
VIKEALIGLQNLCKPVIFFLFLLSIKCTGPKDNTSERISIIWNDGRATGLSISHAILREIPNDSIRVLVEVKLAGESGQIPISGEYTFQQSKLIFRPLIPLTRGMRYAIFARGQLLGEIEIERSTEVPELLAIYPSQDTIPENLLKIYLVFNIPMVENRSLQYVSLADREGNILPNTFLDLHPELWNEDGTILTLWLDPGRIKRDLQPNKSLGPPLISGEQYQVLVSAEWPDVQGATLGKLHAKNLIATSRDTSSPEPLKWKLYLPKAGTNQAFEANLGEPLDYMLLQSTIRLVDSGGSNVHGTTQISDKEKKFVFIPAKPWSSGKYRLEIETILEDLAGNNLNRLFDRDITKSGGEQVAKKIFELEWRVD